MYSGTAMSIKKLFFVFLFIKIIILLILFGVAANLLNIHM